METISFRIDEDIKKELTYVKETLNATQTQAIKDAIHALYQYLLKQEKSKKSPQEIFKESGYIGSFRGKKDLSLDYKRDLIHGLKAKHESK